MCCRNCPYLFQFVWIYFADSVCTAIGLPSASRISGCLPSVTHSLVTTTFFACSKDNTLFIQKTGSPCECLQELPVFVSICLRFTLRILSARQSACPLHPEFPAACPRSRIPWSQRLFSPAPKITLFPYRKQAALAMYCRNCPCMFQLVWIYFADSVCTAIGLPSASRISGCLPSVTHSLVTTTFFACSKDGTSYMVCTKMLSMMERRPLAPVFR